MGLGELYPEKRCFAAENWGRGAAYALLLAPRPGFCIGNIAGAGYNLPMRAKKHFRRWVLLLLGAGVLGVWLYATPPGLLGKADAVAYAVCSRNPLHSPFLGARQMPLCFRDTGMHLGALMTLLFLAWRAPRQGAFPKGAAAGLLGLLAAAFALDGGNSFVYAAKGRALYLPHNALRLATGLGMGIVIGALLYAAFQQTVWQQWEDAPALTLRRLGVLMLLAAAAGAVVWSGNPLALYPLALLSAGDVVLLLGVIYGLFAIGLLRRENTAHTWRDLTGFFYVGWLVAMLQIGLFDALRFAVTHTWGGFPLP